MNLRLGSLFDGIGGFPLAGLRHGFTPVWASEIEPFPIRVTQHHFPSMKHLGDITKINGAEIEPVDVITFGSPCTRLSVAGRHDGFDITFECQGTEEEPHIIYTNKIRATDKYQYIYKDYCPICGKELIKTNESALFFHAIRIIQEMRGATNGTYPRFVVWENVPGAFSSNGGQDFRAVLEFFTDTTIPMPISGGWADAGMVRTNSIDLAWRVLDARYWGVPQRRRRIFLVADFGGERAGEILFVEESLRGNSAESRKAREEAAATVGDGVEKSSECLMFENHGQDTRFKGPLDVAQPVTATFGMGGNNQPFVVHKSPAVAMCINTKNNRFDAESQTFVIEPRSQDGVCRVHNDGAANGFGVGKPGDAMPTLGTGDRHAVAYGVDKKGDDEFAKSNERNAREILRKLREEIRTEAFAEWGPGILNSLQQAEILQPGLYGEALGENGQAQKEEYIDRQPRQSDSPKDEQPDIKQSGLREVREYVEKIRHTPQGLQYLQQFARELDGIMQELPQHDSQQTRKMFDMWQAGKGIRLLRKTLSEIQEVGRPDASQNQPEYPRYAVRRLVPTECLRLQGFPDYWLDIDGMSDTQKYKAVGNSVAIPCVKFVLGGIARVLGGGEGMRTCGTCKYWIPETTGLIARAKAKHPWPHCGINGKTKLGDDKPCLAWTRRKEGIDDGNTRRGPLVCGRNGETAQSK